MAAPRTADLLYINDTRVGVDPKGSLIYRVPLTQRPLAPLVAGGRTLVIQGPDSALLVRADFDRRAIDTLGKVRIRVPETLYFTRAADQQLTSRVVSYPLSIVDDWDVFRDGTIAIVRGGDYHMDWIGPGGSLSHGPRMPFDWRRLSDDDKRHIADSARKAEDDRVHPPGRTPPPAIRDGRSVFRVIGGGSRIDGTTTVIPLDATIESATLPDIPDFYPPIRAGAVKADLDSSVWILPTTSAYAHPGGVVYDVVNERGMLYERVRAAVGRSIAGFGKRGRVYLMWRDSAKVWHLERASVQQ